MFIEGLYIVGLSLGIAFIFVLLIWAVEHANKETPEQIEQRMRSNLKELWENRTAPLLKFKSHEEGEQFLKLVVEGGNIRSLPPVYREQAEKYMKTMPLTIAQARDELKALCVKIYEGIYYDSPSHVTPKACIKEWDHLEEMAKRDQVQYYHAMKVRSTASWFRTPNDDDYIYCVLDIIVQDEFPDTAKLYKYISSLSDEGIEKLMNIIGNKLERLK